MTYSKYFILIVSLLFMAFQAQASGGGGYSGGTGGYSSSQPRQQRQTDPTYEHGKSIYKGRASSYKGINICIASDKTESGATKIKKKTIKHLKGSTYQKLAENLVNCDMPEQLTYEMVEREDFLTLIYYLDKRFKLKLG